MRRSRWIIGICLALGLIVATGPVAFAGNPANSVPAGGNRILRGKTSQGQGIKVVMHRINGGWGLRELQYGALLRCQDGTKIGLEEGWSFGALHPTDGDHFDVDDISTEEAFHFHGRIGPRGGSGTVEVTFATLTQDVQAQTCTSKERTWSVSRTSPSLNGPCCTPKVASSIPVLTITARVGRNGTEVNRSWSDGPITRATSSRKTRSYSGSTSQHLPAGFTTRRFPGSWRLTDTDFGLRLSCDDGSKLAFGSGYGFGGRSGPRLDDSGDFALDEVDIFDAFHVHGRLGPHAGSGTLEDTQPALTKDEKAMLCTTKERTWTADRAPTPVGTPPPPATPSAAVSVRTTSR